MKSLILGAIFLLTGCAVSKEIYTESGERGHSIDCSGSARNWGMCYEKAGELCQEKGYDIVAGGSDSDGTVFATANGAFGGTKNNRNMIIRCKN